MARLAWAAHLGELPGLTVAAIANRLDASSPQSFGRTLRRMFGVTPTQFRARYTGREMLELSLRSIADAVQLDHRRIETLGFAGAIRGARLGAPPQESAEYLDGWDAAIACVAAR